MAGGRPWTWAGPGGVGHRPEHSHTQAVGGSRALTLQGARMDALRPWNNGRRPGRPSNPRQIWLQRGGSAEQRPVAALPVRPHLHIIPEHQIGACSIRCFARLDPGCKPVGRNESHPQTRHRERCCKARKSVCWPSRTACGTLSQRTGKAEPSGRATPQWLL